MVGACSVTATASNFTASNYTMTIAGVVFTHLFAGADAFVAAHLWDLPRQVEFRRLPSGAAAVTARFPFRHLPFDKSRPR